VRVVRCDASSFGGSIVLGPTPATCSQLPNPVSVEPALTCGSCMSAPEDGARVSGAQPVLDTVGAAELGSGCGVNVDL
jgi:hypothetical protein